ncbi:DUF7504 family protein [Halocalculus aciditolerans]|nr:recombinase RecA [Halocalculus aciditolerans]
MYDVGDVLPVDAIQPGTNLMIGGPPMSGKAELGRTLVEDGLAAGDGAVVISTRDDATRLLDDSPAIADGVANGHAGVIDCVTRERGEAARDRGWIRYVSSPGDVTEIGIRTAGFFTALAENDRDTIRGGLLSIPTMLMYTDPRRLFRFLHVFTGKVQSGGHLGIALTELGDRETFERFAPLFDGMIQTRLTDDYERQLRVVGVDPSPTDWVPY